MVISHSASSGRRARTSESSRSTPAALIRLGVPPPMNTLTMGRPQTSGKADSMSVASASRYVASGIPPGSGSWELKSQYGHLRTHHGKWM